ncbi:MAG: helix-turn-helix domain-containing protein [Nodosilinea sp.]
MHLLFQNLAPIPGETLAAYVQRVPMKLGLSQKELAEKAGIQPQSVGKIERGQTTRLKQKPKSSLVKALGIPVDYLDAVYRRGGNRSPQILSPMLSTWNVTRSYLDDSALKALLRLWEQVARSLLRVPRAYRLSQVSILSLLWQIK